MKKQLIIGIWHPSVILTYLGAVFSLMGICVLSKNVTLSVVFLLCAGLCDMFDGAVANSFKRTEIQKQFGIQIDSLADVCSFAIFPAFMLVELCERSFFAYIIAAIYAIFGIARLAWFNIVTEENPKHFIGLPVTFSALFIPIIYIVLNFIKPDLSIVKIVWYIAYALIGILFICSFKMPKPKLLFRIFMLVVAIALMITLVFAL